MEKDIRTIEQVRILCEKLSISENIVCLLHYGSLKQKEDFHSNSDLDFHLVLKKIDLDTLTQIKDIFGFSSKIDLSFHSMDEIVYNNKIIFQNGNQGVYFIHVLSSSETLIGKNIYLDLVKNLDQKEVIRSIIEKIRYYLWFLRRNYVFENNLKIHKKYFIRILKDILILEGAIDYSNISLLNNRQIINLYLEKFRSKMNTQEIQLINYLFNLEDLNKPNIEELILFFTRKINKLIWKNI